MAFKDTLNSLQPVYHRLDEQSNALKKSLLETMATQQLPLNKSLAAYCNILLFLCAHPLNKELLQLAEKEIERLSAALKKAGKATRDQLMNSGLPYTASVSTFSQDLLKWVQQNGKYDLRIDSMTADKQQLNTVLQFTLPPLEKEVTTFRLPANKLFEKLNVKKENRLPFLLSELDRLEGQTYIKDHFFSSLGMYVKISASGAEFSKAYNRIYPPEIYYQQDILKNFDAPALFDTKLPAPEKLSQEELTLVNSCVKNALILLQRETDPVTHIDERSLRLYQLERGISVAIYGMKPERQLPLESYVGYTLFKNGFPAAYGGGWVFGKRSLFGINIFEQMRGGESGYMMCQLLRVYRQAFGIDYFEVEPYQYGKGNPEGISSGAFWFYYRFGFRPVDAGLNMLAGSEAQTIATTKGYRSSEDTLRKFTAGNMVLNFKNETPLSLWDVREKIAAMIAEKHNGNRVEAELQVIRNFIKKAGSLGVSNKHQKDVLVDVAFLAEALKINSAPKLKVLKELIRLKPLDLYAYQKALVKVLR